VVLLILLLLLCFGPYLTTTGFYLDDWSLLSRAMPDGSFNIFSAIDAFAVGGFWLRPAEILHYPLMISLGHLSPWRYRLMGLGLEAAMGGFLFLFLRRLSGSSYLALWAAGFALVFPTHRSTHMWMTNSVPVAAFTFSFAALWAHLKGRSGGGRRWKIGAGVLFVVSLLEYEAAAFMPAALWAGRIAQDRYDGRGWREASFAATREALPFVYVFAGVFVCQRVFVPLMIDEPSRQAVFKLGHLFQVGGAALSVSTVEVVRLVLDSIKRSGGELGLLLWTILFPASYYLARGFEAGRKDEKGLRRAAVILAVSGLALFFVSYIPFFLTGVYTPRMYGVMNRVNLGGGIAVGIMLAASFSLIRFGPRTRVLLGTALISMFAICQWDGGLQWSKAWVRQQEILKDIGEQIPKEPATIVIVSAPPWIHRAPIFKTDYDVTRAIWVTTGRRDIRGDFAFVGRLEPGGMYVLNGDRSEHRYPYKNLYGYNGKTRRLYPVTGPRSDLGF
jgi:hypothetical protein